ncbi:SDR family NAD(P)-dependent oxidoreductase [Viridibacillus arvi]|uniref:SDR family NAD(P)-dependent oxidoreductase n=1 Tax=Viridibacillus arvi TaxID=263475 RepID=UPI0036EEE9DD
MRLEDYVVIVTGAGQGMGQGIAQEFAKEGATVVIAELNAANGKAVEEAINNAGGNAHFIKTDVADEENIENMVNEVIDRYGKIDTLVNNAGVTLFKPLQDITIEDWDTVINIDLKGTFLCCKYVSKYMMQKNRGSIINISSNHSISTLPDTEVYAAAKAGVNGMSRSMSLSLGKYGIRVNTICPGFTDTPHHQKWLSNHEDPIEVNEYVLSLHATPRISTPYDIGRLAVYLASDEAEMVTGSELVIDGGVTSRLYNS